MKEEESDDFTGGSSGALVRSTSLSLALFRITSVSSASLSLTGDLALDYPLIEDLYGWNLRFSSAENNCCSSSVKPNNFFIYFPHRVRIETQTQTLRPAL